MDKNILRVLLLFVSMMALTSCNSAKRQYMNSFEEFVSQVESNHTTYTLEDWKWSFDKVKSFEEQFETYQEKMSSDDIAAIAEYEERYLRTLSHAPGNIISNLTPYISSFFGEEGLDLLQRFGDDLNNVFEDIRDFLNLIRK